MDLTKVLGSLIASGALSKGSGGNVLGSLIGAALGGSQNQKTQGGGALGDILGSVLGGGQSSGGSGGGLGDLLGAVLGGGSKPTSGAGGGLGDILGSLIGGATSGEQRQTQRRGNSSASASDLEDLLGVGKSGGLGGQGGLGGLLGGALAKYGQQNNPSVPSHTHDNCDHLPIGMDNRQANDQATLIIRAMINAAKSDGSIDQKEQDNVIAKLGDVTQEEINFVKAEFAAPLDVKAFARSIPRGMEQQIYTVSLMAIDLDQNAEAHYLASLVKELNISHQDANKLHSRVGAPQIFA
jgi:uncharacterized membrane protein YebE (DUF533 family)